MQDRFKALRTLNVRRYFAGQAVSMIGSMMQMVAQGWLVLRLSGSATALGSTVALQWLPLLVLGSWGGAIADRVDNRKLLMTTSAISASLACGLGVMTTTGVVTVHWVQVFAVALGFVTPFEQPALKAFIYELAGPADVANAVALASMLPAVARLGGPAIAGALIGAVGIDWCFYANAASFLFVIVALASLRVQGLHERRSANREKGQVRAGLAYVWRTPLIRRPIAVMFVAGLLAYNFSTMMPNMAKFVFHVGAGKMAGAMAASAIGGLLGGLTAAGLRNTTFRTLSAASLGFGASLLAFSLAPNYPAWVALSFVIGISSSLFQVIHTTMLQRNTEPAMLGRVMALNGIGFMGTTPFGALLSGWLTAHISGRVPFSLGGSALMGCALFLWMGVTPGPTRRFVRRAAPLPASVSSASTVG